MQASDSRHVAALLERLGRLLGNDAHATDLQPVQWETLRYLDQANRFSRHSAALTAYLGLTKGTVSQTLKTLDARGLVRRRSDPHDRRRNRLELTAKGARALQDDPLERMTAAIDSLPQPTRTSLAGGLRQLLSRRLDAQGRQRFGQCLDCAYFASEHERGNPHYCTLLEESLSRADTEAICHEQVAKG